MTQVQQPLELIVPSQAQRALALAETVDEVLLIRKQAEVVRDLLRKLKDREADLIEAATIRLRSERKLGEFLRASFLASAAPGNQYTGQLERSHDVTGPISLHELGLSKNESSRAQRIAAIPEAVFERYLDECRRRTVEPTIACALRLSQPFHAPGPSKTSKRRRIQPFISCVAQLVAESKYFTTIYADPPWPPAAARRSAGKDLVERLLQEPVGQVAADDCHLHVWTPGAYLYEALGLMQSWQFEPASTLVLLGTSLDEPRYWSGATYFLLLGVRGNLPFSDRNQPACLKLKYAGPSAPAEIVKLIERVSRGPYLEVFCESCFGQEEWRCCGSGIFEDS